MLGLKRWLGLFALLFVGSALAATSAAPQPTTTIRSHVVSATLDNGLRVVVVRNPLAPVVTTEINYLVGSNEAPAGFPGTAHALEHMMFRGSPGLTRDQLAEIAAQMGGDFDADTTQTVTQFFFTTPAADLDVALHIEALRMRGLDVSKGGWSKERGAIEQEVSRDLSSPQYVFYSKLLAAMFKGTPYAHDALGTRPSFNKTSAAMLKHFYRKWYAPNNAILVVVGDVDPAATLHRVKALFGSIPRKKLPSRPTIALQPVSAHTLHLKTDQPYGLAVIAFRMSGYTAKDYAAATILGDALDSRRGRLNALVPEGKALYAGFDAEAMQDVGLGYAIGVFPRGGDAGKLLSDLRQRLAETLKSGVPADLVEAAKRQEIAQLERQKNSVPGLANAWSTALAFQHLDSPEAMKAAFSAVTVADVDRVAQRILNPDHAISAILTPQSSGKPVSAKGFGGAETFSAAPSKPVALPDWAQTSLKKLVVPQTSALKPVETRLPNGLRLIVQPEAVSDSVSVYGSIRNRPALQQPKGQEGVSDVLDQLFGYGGGGLDRDAFQKALDAIGAQESAGTQFSVIAPARHFAQAVQLLADNELRPELPESAFKVVRRQVAGAVAGQLQSPDYLFGRAVSRALLPANDPALRQATPQTVDRLTLPAVKAFYHKVFRPDLTTIVVIGDIRPDTAKAEIEKAFGAWKSQGPTPDLDLPPVPSNRPSRAVVPDSSSLQDTVVLAQNIGVNLDDAQHYALNLGNEVLGQGFYASRLYRDLRARNGLVYTVSSSFDFGRTRSHYRLSYGCDPDKVARARAIAVHDLAQMQTEPVSTSELHRAKAMLLRRLPLQNDSVAQIAGSWLYYAQHGLPLDQGIIAAHHYADLTAAQIQAAYRKWLQPKDLIEVVKGPNPR